MNDNHTAAVSDGAVVQPVNYYFDILNALSLQCWFVDSHSDKACRLSHELDAALVGQEDQPAQIVSPSTSQ